MRVGVYVDGFNLYYGIHGALGGGTGWKWLDIRALASRYARWQGAYIDRVVYCTARVNDPEDPGQIHRQHYYLKALELQGSVDTIEEGYYSSWSKEQVMTQEGPKTKSPTILKDSAKNLTWSPELKIRRNNSGIIFATVRKREEKGSDVNVATHLLTDVLQDDIEAAVVISNDSDLALPIRTARQHVSVGLLNPQRGPLAGALKDEPNSGVGGHWWRRIEPADVQQCQLPDPVQAGGQSISKPSAW